ncbi:hypothetical protein C8Q79DRAFT_957375 [Trametes meyenii]|nr:hypothetical protein C8Q79DRAFT_957375 [Trametes meyenii]
MTPTQRTTDLTVERSDRLEVDPLPASLAVTEYSGSCDDRTSLSRDVAATAQSAGPSSISELVAPGPDVQPEQGQDTEPLPLRRRRCGRVPDLIPISSPNAISASSGATTDHISPSSDRDQTATGKPVEEPVAAFLGSLFPDQSALLSFFVTAGITDGMALGGLARMDGRDKWLYSFVREGTLTELQFVAIQAGLNKMKSA